MMNRENINWKELVEFAFDAYVSNLNVRRDGHEYRYNLLQTNLEDVYPDTRLFTIRIFIIVDSFDLLLIKSHYAYSIHQLDTLSMEINQLYYRILRNIFMFGISEMYDTTKKIHEEKDVLRNGGLDIDHPIKWDRIKPTLEEG